MRFSVFLETDADHARQLANTGFWGKAGAGVIFWAEDSRRFLLAHRSPLVEQPNTWGTWGGAINKGETAEQAAIREAREETGYHGHLHLEPLYTYKHSSGFEYHNFLAITPEEFTPQLDWETQGHAWVRHGEWRTPLHFGLSKLLEHARVKLSAYA